MPKSLQKGLAGKLSAEEAATVGRHALTRQYAMELRGLGVHSIEPSEEMVPLAIGTRPVCSPRPERGRSSLATDTLLQPILYPEHGLRKLPSTRKVAARSPSK
jgi:hypothetical protein